MVMMVALEPSSLLGHRVSSYLKLPGISWEGDIKPTGKPVSLGKRGDKALGTDSQGQRGDKTPGGAPGLGWGCGSAVIQELPPGVTVLPRGGDTAVSAALGHPGGTGPGTKMVSKSLKISGSEEQPPW